MVIGVGLERKSATSSHESDDTLIQHLLFNTDAIIDADPRMEAGRAKCHIMMTI